MRTITKTEVFIRLLFLVCVISGALVSSILSSDDTTAAATETQEVVSLYNTTRK
jgi:hypothetical protein